MMKYRGVWVLLITTALAAGACGRLTGAGDERHEGEADTRMSAQAASQPPAGLTQFSRDALLTLPYCNVARGEVPSSDFKLEVQGDLSSALARVSFPLPTFLPSWVRCEYTYLMYNGQSDWSIVVTLRGPSSQAVGYFFEPDAAPENGPLVALEPAADKPVSGRSGWFWGGGGSLGAPSDVPTAPTVVAWWRANDYVRLVVTGYDVDGVLAIADSVQ